MAKGISPVIARRSGGLTQVRDHQIRAQSVVDQPVSIRLAIAIIEKLNASDILASIK
jgi:hypothetical protein